MAQCLRAPGALPVVVEFNSQQPRGSKQTSIVGSNALSWHAGVHADEAFIYIK